MRRLSADTFDLVFGFLYLGLAVNVLLAATCAPLVLLLITTDPIRSWPLLAGAAVLAAPGLVAALRTFRDHPADGRVIMGFFRAYRAVFRPALALGAVLVGLLVVLLVDVHALAASPIGVVAVPVLLVLTALTLATAVVAAVALAEDASRGLVLTLRLSAVLGLRRWYLTAVSVAAVVVQAVLFSSAPALALGITAAPVLYLLWAGGRATLRPVPAGIGVA